MKRAILLLFTAMITQTAFAQRWYDYVTTILQPYEVSIGNDVNYWHHNMWYDTSAIHGNTVSSGGAYAYNKLVSLGMGLDPTYAGWNTVAFTGMIGIRPVDPYTIDSIFAPGLYARNYGTPAKRAVVDTLIFALTEFSVLISDTTTTYASYYGVSSISYPPLSLDSLNNCAGGAGVTSIYKFLLNNTDTTSIANSNTIYPRPGHIPVDPVISFPVAAGQKIAMTITFKSGDASYPVLPTRDTIRYSSGTAITGVKYGYWEPQIGAAVDTTGSYTLVYPPYDSTNFACGHFAFEGQGWPYRPSFYTPNWKLVSDTPSVPSPSFYQYPHIGFHIDCITCPLLMPSPATTYNVQSLVNANAYPNPANNELIISYGHLSNLPAIISITNILGQVVDKRQADDGSAKFETTALPTGIYIYTIQAEGQRVTGRVSITH